GMIARTMRNGELDRLEVSAPQPVIVVEIGVAVGPGGPRAVTLHAVDEKSGPPAGDSGAHQFTVLGQTLDRDLRERGEDRGAAFGFPLHFLRQLAAAAPTENPLGGLIDERPGGIEHDVDHAPNDGEVERPEPPPGHRRIEFLDTVPLVSYGF